MEGETVEIYDVVVLGAGLSGLYAARELLRAAACAAAAGGGACDDGAAKPPAGQSPPRPLRVAVLEARGRVGGRTRSVAFNGDAFDVGGQWVGPGQTLVMDLVEELGIPLKYQQWFAAPPAPAAAKEGGRPSQGAPAATAAAAGGSFSSGCAVPLPPDAAAEVAQITSEIDAASKSSNLAGPPWSGAAAEWDATDCAAWLARRCSTRGALREMLLFVQTVLAADPASVSFLFLLLYVRAAGGMAALGDGPGGAQTARLKGGAQQLSRALAAAVAAAGGRVLLRREAVAVAEATVPGAVATEVGANVWYEVTANVLPPDSDDDGDSDADGGGDGAGGGDGGAADTASTPAPPPGHQVRLLARRVIVAMPPPVWRRLRFEPPLPPGHRALAEGMAMGCVVKVLAVYPRRFWAFEGEEAAAAKAPLVAGGGGDGDAEAADAGPDVRGARDAGSSAGSGGGLRFAGGAGLRLEEAGPIANLFGGDYGGAPALVGLVTGADAVAFAALPEAAQKAAALAQLERYFGTPEAAAPAVFLAKDWMSERFSGGCFGGLTPPGLLTAGGGDAAAARAGAPAGGVHFAGSEAAGRWVGYFEGALDAGARAAHEVLAALGRGGAPAVAADAAAAAGAQAAGAAGPAPALAALSLVDRRASR